MLFSSCPIDRSISKLDCKRDYLSVSVCVKATESRISKSQNGTQFSFSLDTSQDCANLEFMMANRKRDEKNYLYFLLFNIISIVVRSNQNLLGKLSTERECLNVTSIYVLCTYVHSKHCNRVEMKIIQSTMT